MANVNFSRAPHEFKAQPELQAAIGGDVHHKVTEEEMKILLQSNDKKILDHYNKISFLQENSPLDPNLSQTQKDLLVKLVGLNHEQTIKDIKGSEFLTLIVCNELEQLINSKQCGQFSNEATVYRDLISTFGQEKYHQLKELLKIMDFINKKETRELMASGAIGTKSKYRPGFMKIKATEHKIPFDLKYNPKNGDVVVKIGGPKGAAYIGKGQYRTFKQCLLLSATQFSMIAEGKQRLPKGSSTIEKDKNTVALAKNEIKVSKQIEGKAPHVIQLREVKEFTSHKTGVGVDVIRTTYTLCNMGNLMQVLQNSRFSPEAQLQISLDILLGIKELHAEGILHRDLKPENIFLHKTIENGKEVIHAYVGDLGFACKHDDTEMRKIPAGSALYMHPSVLLREETKKDEWQKEDVWAAGLLLATIFRGYTPLDAAASGGDIWELIEASVELGRTSPPPDTDSIDYVIGKMLQSNSRMQMGLDEAISKIERLLEKFRPKKI